MPVYVAAMGPANLRLTGELADGWLGNAFIPESAEVFLDPLREGAESAGRTLADLDLLAPVAVEIVADDEEARVRGRHHADGYAFTIGAMGTGSTNFYNEAFGRLGFADEVAEVARLWQDGDARGRGGRRTPRARHDDQHHRHPGGRRGPRSSATATPASPTCSPSSRAPATSSSRCSSSWCRWSHR